MYFKFLKCTYISHSNQSVCSKGRYKWMAIIIVSHKNDKIKSKQILDPFSHLEEFRIIGILFVFWTIICKGLL